MRRAPSMPLTMLTMGYHAYAMSREKFIIPPLCEVAAGPILMGLDPEFDDHAHKYTVVVWRAATSAHRTLAGQQRHLRKAR